jgi:hypothetical protein
MPKQRAITLVIHNYLTKPDKIALNKQLLTTSKSLKALNKLASGYYFDKNKRQLMVKFNWQQSLQNLLIN